MTLARPKPKRERSGAHLEFLRQLPCIACAVEGVETPPRSVDAAHVSFLGAKGFGSKVSDAYAAPVCRTHHADQHAKPPERRWWARLGINAKSLCEALSAASGNVAAGEAVIADYADRARRLPRLVSAAALLDPTADTFPQRCTIQAHATTERDEHGNVCVLIPMHTGSKDGVSRAWCSPTSLEDESASSVAALTPNPAGET